MLYMAAAAPGTIIRDCAQTGEDEISVLDEMRPDIVGVTAFTSTRHDALAVLEAAKARGARTVLGGPHVASPRIARQIAEHYPFVDHIVRGDGERAWARLVAGEELPRISLDYCADLDMLPLPDWSAVDLAGYPPRDSGIYHGVDLEAVPRVSVVFSRGCIGRCQFCAAWRRPARRHSPPYVRRMLEPLAALGIRHLCIDDDCWAMDEDEALEVCGILDDLGFVWQAETRCDLLTPGLADAMADAGCYQVCVGLEHGSVRMREAMGKALDPTVVLAARSAAAHAGLRFSALMMEGYPGETQADRDEAASFMAQLAPDNASSFGGTILLPHTWLYETERIAGRVSDDIWLGPGRHLIATPDGPQMMGE